MTEEAGGRGASGLAPAWEGWLFSALVVLLAAALVDVMIETVLAGSSLRWWILGGALGSLAVVGALWTRTGWSTKAGLLTLSLAGVLAGSAWLPDGLEHGVAAAGQSTSAVLAGTLALALMVAAAAAARWRFLHWGGRVAVGLLAAYGVVGFVLAILDGVSFARLFYGGGFFEKAPWYLQGTVVGALGVLPLVALVELGRATVQVRGRAFRAWAVQLLGLGAAGAIAAAGLLGYHLDVVLARGVDEERAPVDATRAFSEDVEAIHLALRSALGERSQIRVRWVAVETLDLERNHVAGESGLSLDPGERGALRLDAPKSGFSPGRWRAEIEVDGEPGDPLEFEVSPLLPPPALLADVEIQPGYNLARDALGGRVVSFSSEYDSNKWAARNLIDGGTVHAAMDEKGKSRRSAGWSTKGELPPHEVVLGFPGSRPATLQALILDPHTASTEDRPEDIPKHVEVWASTNEASGTGDDWTQVGSARLRKRMAPQVILLDGARAAQLKLRFTSNHGGSYVQLGEVRVIEDASSGSVLDGVPINLALPRLGGAVVRMSSQRDPNRGAVRLVDGDTDQGGWRTQGAYLPAEVVFAFRDDREAQIERVVLVPWADQDPQTWPTRFSIEVSSATPLDGFSEVGTFELDARAGPQSFPVGRPARFLKLRILENGGGGYTALREVQVLEGREAGTPSVLWEPREQEADWRTDGAAQAGRDVAGADVESENNDTAASANRLALGRYIRGRIDPLGESDYFALEIPAQSVLTLDLLGSPYIRQSLALLDPGGATRKRFDPGERPGAERTFSWRVRTGDHRLRVTEPPISLVLIWDTSGSMRGRTEDLRVAVEAYIDQVQPSERLQLIEFSSRPRVLTSDFSNDRAALRVAAQGKFDAGGGTALYDSIQKATELLDGVAGNRAIVIMTDGEDSGSRLDYGGFWELLDEKRIRIYTIGLGQALENFLPALGNSPRRMLGHVALATNGRSFFAASSDELKGYYQEIADELRTLATYHVRPALARGPGQVEVVATGERIAKVSVPQFELILDASGSMIERRRKIDGRYKMDVAKDVAISIVRDILPDDAPVAFRVYGRRIREGRRGDCQDSELIFPFGPVDKPRLIERIQQIKALGTTPLAYSLEQAAKDFGDTPGEKLIILVTDGKEECGGSPTETVQWLREQGFQIRVDVVGFALAEDAVKQEMTRVAEITGGRFHDARDAQGLRDAIKASLAVPYDVLDAAGERVAGGHTGRAPAEVPEGVYTVVVRTAGEPVVVHDVAVAFQKPTRVEIEKQGEEVGVRVVTDAAAP